MVKNKQKLSSHVNKKSANCHQTPNVTTICINIIQKKNVYKIVAQIIKHNCLIMKHTKNVPKQLMIKSEKKKMMNTIRLGRKFRDL